MAYTPVLEVERKLLHTSSVDRAGKKVLHSFDSDFARRPPLYPRHPSLPMSHVCPQNRYANLMRFKLYVTVLHLPHDTECRLLAAFTANSHV